MPKKYTDRTQNRLPIDATDRVDWRPPQPPDLSRYDTVQIDFETTGVRWARGDKPVGLVVGYGDQTAYLPFAHRGGGNLDEGAVKRWAERELRGKRIENHTIGFDLHMARCWGVDLAEQGNTFHDVSHSAALLDDHRYRFNLKALSAEYLPPEFRKKEHPTHAEHLWELPAWDVEDYARYDAIAVRELRKVFAPKLASAGLDRVQALEDAVIPATVELEHNGCPIDVELLETWVRDSQAQLEERLWRVQRSLGFQVNPGSSPDLARVFRHLGLPIEKRTAPSAKHPLGQPSFTAEVLKEITHPTVQDLYYCRKLHDIRNKFLLPYRELIVDGVLYPTFHQLANDTDDEGKKGTVSGRYSSAHPNVQAVLGKDKMKNDYKDLIYAIRKLFISRTGWWYCADQAQVEFRLAVHVAAVCGITGAEALVQRYLDNPKTDFHAIVGEMIAKKRPDLTRTQIKITNFRRLYGGGATAISRSLKISKPDADSICRDHGRAFPPLVDVLKWAQTRAETRGEVRSILGRRSTFPRDAAGQQERTYSALNRIIQPSAADGFKVTLVDVYNERKRLGLTLQLICHDELGAGLADPAMAPVVDDFLNQPRLPTRVPILWDGGVGKNWHEAKEA